MIDADWLVLAPSYLPLQDLRGQSSIHYQHKPSDWLATSPLSNHLPVRDGLALVSTGVVTPRGSLLCCSLLLSPPPNGLCELAALCRLVLEDFGIVPGADETVRIAAV